jgi:hypothetical protein
MTLAIAIEKRFESESALEIMGHVRDRSEGLNKVDIKAAFIDPNRSNDRARWLNPSIDGQTYSSSPHAGGIVRKKVNGPPPDGRPYPSTNAGRSGTTTIQSPATRS